MTDDVFTAERPRLFAIAYRMLGSVSDAEDVLQDAWVRYRTADQADIRSPKAFAMTIVTRLALDRLKSARTARETYVGPWLPEPVLTGDGSRPDQQVQRSESITLAFLVLLEALSPEERAVFLLKDVFEYEHTEIAGMLGTTPANSRQLLRRAKLRLVERRPRLSGTAESRRAVAEQFAQAFTASDAQALTALLAKDVGFWSDGGGKATAARRPLLGREEVLHFLLGIQRVAEAAGALQHASLTVEEVNAEPAVVLRVRQQIESIFVVSVEDGAITGIRVMRNPDKLAHIDRRLTLH